MRRYSLLGPLPVVTFLVGCLAGGCGGEFLPSGPTEPLVGPQTGAPPTTDPPPLEGCQTDETPFGGHCYAAPGIKGMTIDDAEAVCESRGARMVRIDSTEENAFVHSLLPFLNQAAWIGLRRASDTFRWWPDGAPATFTNWAPGEPNNERGENCVVMWGPRLPQQDWRGKWNDAPCNKPGRDTVICERAP